MEQFAALVANMPTNEDAFLLFNILVNNFLRLVPIIDWEKSSPFPGKFHSHYSFWHRYDNQAGM